MTDLVSPSDTATVTIDALGAQGDGVAAAADGQIYVPYALPGESVEIARVQDRGRLLRVLIPSADRIKPVCRHFRRCGGCAMQHLKADAYRTWKRALVVDALAARGLAPPVADLVSLLPNRRRAAFSARRTRSSVVLGFHEPRGADIVDLLECVVLSPALVASLTPLRHLLRGLAGRRDEARASVTAADNGLDVVITGIDRTLDHQLRADLAAAAAENGWSRLTIGAETVFCGATPLVRFGTADVALPPGAFLQASVAADQAMAQHVIAGVGGARHVADLFSGVGTLTFPLARTAAVTAYDSDRPSIDAVLHAARNNQGLKPIAARPRDLFREPLEGKELAAFDAVVFDPPYAGARAQAEALAQSDIPIVVGVSCNPATFARDARLLVDGGYALQAVTPIDQFVYTAHVELVGVFARGERI